MRLAKSYSLPSMPFGALKERDHIPFLDPVVRASRDEGRRLYYHMHQSKFHASSTKRDIPSYYVSNLQKRMLSSTATPLASMKDGYILQIISIKGAQVHLPTYTRKQTCTVNYEKVNARDPCCAPVLVLNATTGGKM